MMSERQQFDALWTSYWAAVQKAGPLTRTRYRLMLREMPRGLPAGARILDVGCGSGTFLGMLALRYPTAVLEGVEISEAAVAGALPALRDRIHLGNILDLAPQLPAAGYQVIVCSEVLEHVPDPDSVVAALVSLLKPGGRLVTTVPAGMRHWSAQDEAAGHLRRFEVDEFVSLLARCGLKDISRYTWGGPVSAIYNWLVSSVGPERSARSGASLPGRMAAAFFAGALRMDDLFRSDRGFQLVARAMRPL